MNAAAGAGRIDGADGSDGTGDADGADDAQRSGLVLWWAGVRPRTLVAAIVPVAVGAATAVGESSETQWWRAIGALFVALALQVAVNLANDYSDGIRGTDDTNREGPLRLVGSGLVHPRFVRRAAIGAFAVAGVVGAFLALVVGPELFVVGLFCLVAGWTYTGGPRPYGYHGLGEVFVFVFFGLVATIGTNYVLTEKLDGLAVSASLVVGLWATALLVINNLRDIPGDRVAGKITLAVRLGDTRTRWLFVVIETLAMLIAALITLLTGRLAVVALLGSPFLFQAIRSVCKGATGAALIPVLGATARVQLVSGLAMAIGIAVSA